MKASVLISDCYATGVCRADVCRRCGQESGRASEKDAVSTTGGGRVNEPERDGGARAATIDGDGEANGWKVDGQREDREEMNERTYAAERERDATTRSCSLR